MYAQSTVLCTVFWCCTAWPFILYAGFNGCRPPWAYTSLTAVRGLHCHLLCCADGVADRMVYFCGKFTWSTVLTSDILIRSWNLFLLKTSPVNFLDRVFAFVLNICNLLLVYDVGGMGAHSCAVDDCWNLNKHTLGLQLYCQIVLPYMYLTCRHLDEKVIYM